ncbi:uncharacterized protein A4U43_C10F2730 [Asparagus officinalis]|uniref:SANT domain-containing protein n=1 Tax=Asparagus officinalis TaxID=4686 RepID=A0A5P1E086_ASPOF|nr:TSL-kinase interacting protein 1 isoform X2 [Asparagus officinalis]ONK55962.1 uncharacterized protein A4U43_C10F2730 [Asparagus officinalis]
METQPHVPSQIQGPQAEDLLINDRGSTAPATPLVAVNEKPAKKVTRQWAAWTRQEEENFFNALRQVGKNFEKITFRVQSKNKNQVRHYYYRLVRRMNKLLGPGLCLDAKNSKDTIAAMLRWWSLLEKHSCPASKLHLKPRRFKIFLESLENQLLKDRNKIRRKRPSQGEKYLNVVSATSLPSKALENDVHPVVDIQNTSKVESNGPSQKRNMSANINFSKGELPPARSVRQKRRPAGLVASAAYRRWEKAAMAGVSLVADAAEQLERATNGGNCSVDQIRSGQKNIDCAGNNQGHLCPPTLLGTCLHQIKDAVMQPVVKLKLQLFPIDEITRKALEKDACNPHLELTLSSRKRISSVLEHLNRKWGSSSIASGELTLLPYSAQQEDISYRKWTAKDTISSAADVYAAVGSPTIFRLRYGWFSNTEPVMRETPNVESPGLAQPLAHISEQPMKSSGDLSTPLSSTVIVHEPIPEEPPSDPDDELLGSSALTPTSENRKRTGDGHCSEQQQVSVVDWVDSLTNISIGDLLSEASRASKSSCGYSSLGKTCPSPQEKPFSSDAFDPVRTQTASSSMWNAEETCDEFSFRMARACMSRDSPSNPSIKDHKEIVVSESLFKNHLKVPPKSGDLEVASEAEKDTSYKEDKDVSPKDINLMDIYWPDSLGPLELEMPSSSRYQGQDVVIGDSNSFGFLGRMISNSLDAFQNFSLFGQEKSASIHLDTNLS